MERAANPRVDLSKWSAVVRIPLDPATGLPLPTVDMDGVANFIDPSTAQPFTASALKRYCKHQAKNAAAAARRGESEEAGVGAKTTAKEQPASASTSGGGGGSRKRPMEEEPAAAATSTSAARPPLVSVIVPARNALRLVPGSTSFSFSPGGGATWLDEALASVLAQTHRPLELSIFDDASDDGTAEAIAAWAVKLRAAGVGVIASGRRWESASTALGMQVEVDADAEAGGTGAARNAAVAHSSGEYLCFLDVDDVMLPDRVQRQLAASVGRPRAIVGGGFVREPV